MGSDVLGFQEIDRSQLAIAGGKGAHLGELSRIDGIRVPPGFCITTDAYLRIVADAPGIDGRIEQLSHLDADDRGSIRQQSAALRQIIETTPIPEDLAASITEAVAGLGEGTACAVRSSATAEDLPTASFAGQHDSYLNVVGPAAILAHVTRCWASLFTERAGTYRLRNGIDHRRVHMAVVVQQMVLPTAAGVLFTADPVSSNRTVAVVEATFGLGEALVAGLVDADTYTVRGGEVVARAVATKERAMEAVLAGGTQQRAIEPADQRRAALTDAQAVELVHLGRSIEAHLGRPQDIEWCLDDDGFQIVQSRPITTLYPVPAAPDDATHVYLSVGHQQMMIDAMKPLGLSMWQLQAFRPMYAAGGRLFVDVAGELASPTRREALVEMIATSDPLTGDALRTLVERGVVPTVPDDGITGPPAGRAPAPIEADPAIVTALIDERRASLAELARAIRTQSGPALLDFILADIQRLKQIVFDPVSHQVVMGGMEAAWWLNDHLEEWLGEKNVADTLTLSVPHNITSQMGLALLDVADVIRPHPEVVAYLQHLQDEPDEGFLAELPGLPGGVEARAAIDAFLETYGMRCVGEIDITRPRWSERPTTLVPLILGNIRNFEPGASARHVEQGRQEAHAKELEVLARLRDLPDGAAKAEETKQMIDRVRAFAGYREHPKYVIVTRSFVYKQALWGEADRLVQANVLGDRDDIAYLTFQELHDVVRSHRVDDALIAQRKETFAWEATLTPPRVITSDGEVVTGTYRGHDAPAGALVGLPVSSGFVEGRARVVHDIEDAELEAGDILVTAFTDPSWSPLFVVIAGLVTEVGGLMTHGAVIAREYGVTTVVGVEHATRLIRDGQRIRVHGTQGYVELLTD